jgi:hypothetical protein
MIAFAYVLGLISVAIAAVVFWGGFAEERRAERMARSASG